ncbi:MAG TPA: CHAT domain-containing protein [Actinophytocola sp.]|uniref:CHAT domain-containing protein n=1 Tax=Actinophytocola sp. TaxID=1872138 RepID=UPI002DDD6CF0|nr:CHAT domain-containing protein [Actinophytocola sp.]HEV2782128.1 CHAT domain-containing protein [Actinophytocola sp.]
MSDGRSSRDAAREQVLRQAAALRGRARDATYAYSFAEARRLLREALAVLDTLDASGDVELTALRVYVLVSLAYAETEGGPIAVGLEHLDAADALLATIPDGARRTELAGAVLQQRGFLLIRAGRIDDGLEELDVAAQWLESGLASGFGDPNVLASLYLNQSLAHIGRAQPRLAARALERCIELCDQHEVHPIIGIKARHNLGYVAYMTGDMPTALRYYEDTARSCQTRAPGMLPVVRLDQARALLAAGLVENAARHLDEALPLLRRRRAGQDVAEAEVTRAAAALLEGDVRRAARLARSAERRFTRRGNTRWAAIAALAELRAATVAALGARRIPESLPTKAVKLSEHLRALMLEDETELALMLAVRLEIARGEPAAAALLLDQVRRPRATSPVDHRMLRRLCRAELAVAEGNPRAALAEARAGLAELGRARDRMGGLELVCGTAIHGQELGELGTRLVLQAGRTNVRQLFGWLERTRAQVYRYEPMPTIDDPVLAEKVDELRSKRRAVQLERVAGRPARRQARQVAMLEREIVSQGWYATPWGRPKPVATFADVASALGDRALITFATSGDELVAVVATASRARLVRLGSASLAGEWAARLHADLDALAPDSLPGAMAAVVARSASRTADALDAQLVRPLHGLLDRSVRTAARALDTQLVRPLSTLTGGRELIVVPTGALYAVPWGSLPSLAGCPVVVAPSATAWLAAERGEHHGDRVVLARGPLLTEAIAEEGPLRTIYPNSVRLSGTAATVSTVLDALDGAGIAHLAAHGAHEPTNALFSRLELADGPLFAHELSRLREPPRQVVLAACELAMNHIRPGDEALGFAGALLAGGVRTVVAAISRVGDLAAATAMVDYHTSVAAGTRPAVALAEAIAADPFRRPFICLGAG